ncbi:hypothetical protein BDZ97DRAFT_1789261 [Flammula alnicola]|nr:hypothetical protein BDZ97DRAFT_1789261 [Flammula alnicola]
MNPTSYPAAGWNEDAYLFFAECSSSRTTHPSIPQPARTFTDSNSGSNSWSDGPFSDSDSVPRGLSSIPFAMPSHPTTTTAFISQEAVQYGLVNSTHLTQMTWAEFERYIFAQSPAQDAPFVFSPNQPLAGEIPQQSETSSSPQHFYPSFPSTSGIQLQSMLPAGQEPSSGVVRNENRRARNVDPIRRASRPPKPNSNQPIRCELRKIGGAEDERCGMVFANTKAMMVHISDMVCGHCIPNHKNDKTQRSCEWPACAKSLKGHGGLLRHISESHGGTKRGTKGDPASS